MIVVRAGAEFLKRLSDLFTNGCLARIVFEVQTIRVLFFIDANAFYLRALPYYALR